VNQLARSLLYVPGDRPDRVTKAVRSGADAVILDLEDGVAPDRKEHARGTVAATLAAGAGVPLWVRIDARHVAVDVAAVVTRAAPAGLVIPMAEPGLLGQVDELVSAAEAASGLRPGSVPVLALLETALGVVDVLAVARSPRVIRLGLGEADLAGELGLRPDSARTELWSIRSAVVVASAAAGIHRPVGPVHATLDDDAGLLETTRLQLRQGFRARTAIHPQQVRIINEVHTSSTDEIAAARAILDTYASGLAAGHGAVTGPDGRLLDAATVRDAQDVVARAEPSDRA
jgi:citrate lyase subunit beta/citryl-CoA lyase